MQKEKYIYAKHLIGKSFTTSLFVWLTMVSLDFAVSFVSELENLSDSHNFLSLLMTTLLEQPHKGLQYLETSMLIGTLIALTLFNQQGNLIFLRSLGFSPAKIVLISGIGPLFLSFSLLALDEFVFIDLTNSVEIDQRASGVSESDQKAYEWQLNDQNLIGIQDLGTDELAGVQLIEFNKAGLVIRAEQFAAGSLENNQLSLQPIAGSSAETEIFPFYKTRPLNKKSLERSSLLSLLEIKKSYTSPEVLSELRLIQSAVYTKIFLPISVIGIIFFAGSLMFGLVRSGGIGRQVIFGIFFGLIFDLTKDLFVASFLIYQWPIILAHTLPILGLILAGWIGYRHL
ncbi:LptF/LptG family permease [Gammaproteobacteria bacterium]|nr:LptF/LptG family permease [Gammaproteobacteria bacterium]